MNEKTGRLNFEVLIKYACKLGLTLTNIVIKQLFHQHKIKELYIPMIKNLFKSSYLFQIKTKYLPVT